jgi:hypothetical protein
VVYDSPWDVEVAAGVVGRGTPNARAVVVAGEAVPGPGGARIVLGYAEDGGLRPNSR